jgi:hypothetical protein
LLEDDLRRLRGFSGDDLGAWLVMVATQVAANHVRRLARQPKVEFIDTIAQVAALPPTDLMTTADAAAYCGFKTTAGLRKAKMQGRVVAVGRRGGVGPMMWHRSDLDHFLRGAPPGRTIQGCAGSPRPRGEHEQEVGHAM